MLRKRVEKTLRLQNMPKSRQTPGEYSWHPLMIILGQPARSLFHCQVASLGGIGISEDATAVAAICEGCGAFAPWGIALLGAICFADLLDKMWIVTVTGISTLSLLGHHQQESLSSWSDNRLKGYPETSHSGGIFQDEDLKPPSSQNPKKIQLSENPDGNSPTWKVSPKNPTQLQYIS